MVHIFPQKNTRLGTRLGGESDPLGIAQKRLNVDHFDKCYKHKPESIVENEMQKIIWDLGSNQKTKSIVN